MGCLRKQLTVQVFRVTAQAKSVLELAAADEHNTPGMADGFKSPRHKVMVR